MNSFLLKMWPMVKWNKERNPVEYSVFTDSLEKFFPPAKEIKTISSALCLDSFLLALSIWKQVKTPSVHQVQLALALKSIQVHRLVTSTFGVLVQATSHLYSQPQWESTKIVLCFHTYAGIIHSPESSLRDLFKTCIKYSILPF